MKRRYLAIFVGIALGLVLPPAMAFAETLTLVNLDCGDGNPLQVTVDPATLTELQASVQAMLDNPSGLTCTLSTSPVLISPLGLGTSALASSNQAFVVGGGRYAFSPSCEANFAISAHQIDSTGAARGSETFTFPSSCTDFGQGHLKADVYCVSVTAATTITPAVGEVIGNITEATNSLSLRAGSAFFSGVSDNPSIGPPDQIVQAEPSTGFPCDPPPVPPFGGAIPIDNGNITVRTGG
jgi:hypothetical protein